MNNELLALDTGELLNKSVENNEGWLEELFVLKVSVPPELVEKRSNGTSMFGVAFLLASFSGEVARED